MSIELYNKLITYAKKMQDVAKIAWGYYLDTRDVRFAEIAIATGMLTCHEFKCKRPAIDLNEDKKPVCKKHY